MSLVTIKIPNSSGVAGKKYWRSLNQVADTPEFREFVHREFPSNASEMLDGNSRRTVLKLMAASLGLAGLTACRRPVEHILPNSAGIEAADYAPGEPLWYTTVHSMGGHVTGLLAETHDGRPTKIEGNPDHVHSLGAATSFHQASVLSLYDPDRSSKVLQGGKEAKWADFEAAAKKLPLADGAGLRILSEAITSPTLNSLRGDLLKKYPKAKWVEYEPVGRENELAGAALAFGQPLYSHPHYDQAKVILALDFDFLGLDSPAPFMTKLFVKGRKVENEEDLSNMNRLYAVESQFSITGANADHRLRMKGSEVKQFASDLANALGAVTGLNVVNNSATDKRAKFLAALAKDLKAAGKDALVVAGPRQPASVQALAMVINQALGSTAITYSKPVIDKSNAGVDSLKALAAEMTAGQVSTLVILGGNPVYSAPADLAFGAALGKVANSIHLGLEADETALTAKWHVPEAHYLESWGDQATSEGLASIQQPMIQPLYGGKTASEIVSILLGEGKSAHDIVKAYWLGKASGNKELAWKKALHDGTVAGSQSAETVKVTADAKKVAAALAAEPKPADGIEVGFYPGAATWDGRFANNGWLQETPDPITKNTWGNAALVAPSFAKAQKLADGDVIKITKGSRSLEAAVMVQPGHADNAISIALGYGREKVGRVGKDVGFNANVLRTTADYWFATGATISATGKTYKHATTQEHGVIDDGGDNGERQHDRPIVREATAAEYKKEPKIFEEMAEVPDLHSIYPEIKYDKGYQWGMAIDLSTCTGCSACIVACTAENNIPVVGREQVIRGREMHWLRMDRYYTGDENDPQLVEQPLPCQQCENAPCENVCPVAATTHSPEGLNDMAYNRCVGTRYCANNCPFKVRHFNFMNYHKLGGETSELVVAERRAEEALVGLVYNPDVTVRMRGVMEKCTYCVQRIEQVRIATKREGRREIKDGEIKTACQQTCPADAIAFGNINDPESKVSKLKKQERNYALLAELAIKPRTTYLAKLRNPNPELVAEGGRA